MKKTLLAILASCFAINATAAVHTYEFEAEVSWIWDMTAYKDLQSTVGQLPGTSAKTGERVAGRFSYDTETPTTASGNFQLSKQNTLTFIALPSAYARPPSQQASLLIEGEGFRNYFEMSFSDIGFTSTSLIFSDTSKTALSNDTLPDQLSLNNLKAFVSTVFRRGTDGHTILSSSTLTSLKEVSAVPEVETYMMLLAGLFFMLVVLRRTDAARRIQA